MSDREQSRRDAAKAAMLTAWKLRRLDSARDFADCLRAAWRWVKAGCPGSRLSRTLARGGRVALHSTVTTSTGRAAISARYIRNADWQAAGLTGRLSW